MVDNEKIKPRLMKYEIISITHSGRKGPRGEPVDDEKYDGMIGSIIVTRDLNHTRQYEEITWDFLKTNSQYEWWHTSAVLGLVVNAAMDEFFIETINTIYDLKKVGDDG